MNRDERAILETVLQRAGIEATIDESRGYPAASFSVAFPDLPEKVSFLVDAPPGWVRVATTKPTEGLSVEARHGLGLLYTRTGFGHVHFAPEENLLRIAASVQAVERAPIGSALLAALDHVARIRHAIATGEGDVRAVPDPTPVPDEPTLADAVRVLDKVVTLVPEKDGSFVGGLHEPRSGTQCALRIHTAAPGIFALDAWALPPVKTPVTPETVDRVDRFDTTLAAGALVLFHDGLLLYRWACPYRWLDLDELEGALPVQVALDAFMRWRAGGSR